jgi:hypothetical protein
MKRDDLPLKHYKFLDHWTAREMRLTYIEARQGQATRQVRVAGQRYLGSNVAYPGQNMGPPSCAVDYDAAPEVIPISQSEFEHVWQRHVATRRDRWVAVKRAYPLGTVISGGIRIFYPQGVLVYLGGDALGLADYEAFKASTRPEYLYTGHKLTATVQEYGEADQWLILADPHVLAARLKFPDCPWTR